MNSTCSFTINLQNSTILYQYVLYQSYELVLYKVFIPCIILVGLTGNVMFIWTVIRVSSLHTATFIYLFTLAWSDLFTLMGFVIFLTDCFLISPLRFGIGSLMHDVAQIIRWFSFITSTWFITLVSLERYLAICYPMKHRLLKGTKRAIKFCLLSMALSLGIATTIVLQHVGKTSIWCFVWPSDDKFENYPSAITAFSGILDSFNNVTIFLHISYIVVELFILYMNCYMYSIILITLYRRKHNTALQMSVELDRNIQQISTMVIANGIVFFLCNTVLNALLLYTVMDMLGLRLLTQHEIDAFEHVQNIFILINASVNPLIYFIINPSYRRALKASILNCCK